LNDYLLSLHLVSLSAEKWHLVGMKQVESKIQN